MHHSTHICFIFKELPPTAWISFSAAFCVGVLLPSAMILGFVLSFFYEMRYEEKITLFIQHPIITLPSTKYRIKKKKSRILMRTLRPSINKQGLLKIYIHVCFQIWKFMSVPRRIYTFKHMGQKIVITHCTRKNDAVLKIQNYNYLIK